MVAKNECRKREWCQRMNDQVIGLPNHHHGTKRNVQAAENKKIK
jgi:hypothetical protein